MAPFSILTRFALIFVLLIGYFTNPVQAEDEDELMATGELIIQYKLKHPEPQEQEIEFIDNFTRKYNFIFSRRNTFEIATSINDRADFY